MARSRPAAGHRRGRRRRAGHGSFGDRASSIGGADAHVSHPGSQQHLWSGGDDRTAAQGYRRASHGADADPGAGSRNGRARYSCASGGCEHGHPAQSHRTRPVHGDNNRTGCAFNRRRHTRRRNTADATGDASIRPGAVGTGQGWRSRAHVRRWRRPWLRRRHPRPASVRARHCQLWHHRGVGQRQS